MQQRKLLVIVCVTAGKQDQVTDTIRDVLTKRKSDYRIVTIKFPPDMATIHKKVSVDDFTTIAVYGGDGTVAAALKCFGGIPQPLLLLPGGTANVLTSYFGMPSALEECLHFYLNNTLVTKRIDIATINGEPFVLDMHMGLWTDAISDTPRELKRRIGPNAYAWSALKKSGSAKLQTYEFAINDKPPVTVHGYTFIVVNQGNHNVLGISLFPHDHAPGHVQFAIIKTIQPLRLTVWLIGKLFGKNFSSIIEVHRSKRLTIVKAPRRTISDDSSRKIDLPVEIIAGRYMVKILTPPAAPNIGIQLKVYKFLRLQLHRAVERIQIFTGLAPAQRFDLVAPNFYLGGKYPEHAYRLFREMGITGVVSMRRRLSTTPPDIDLLSLPTVDMHPPSLTDLAKGVAFIREHISNGGAVYVHCRLGEGRGPSMAAAYLIADGYSVEEALALLKKYRPNVRPNLSQRKRLAEWQEQCNTPANSAT